MMPILVQSSNAVGVAILLEATLSFLGLGIQPPTPSLGTMLHEAKTVLGLAPWYPVFPGLTVIVLVISLNMIADGLQEEAY
jgi:peptide/nickel transport system permease protein